MIESETKEPTQTIEEYLEEQRHAELDEKYTQYTRRLLAQYPHLSQRQFAGDYAATDALVDIHAAIDSAGLTEKQTEAIYAIYFEGYSQVDYAKKVGIANSTAAERLESAIKKVAQIIEYGDWRDKAEGERGI